MEEGVTVEIDRVGFEIPASRTNSGGYEMIGRGDHGEIVATFFFKDWNKMRRKHHRHSTTTCRGERVVIPKSENLVILPKDLPLEVAVSLPYRALMAYRAVDKAKQLIKDDHTAKTAVVIASHGLGLWTVQTALSMVNSAGAIRWVVIDVSPLAEEYIQAVYHNNFSTLNLLIWPPNCYEEDLKEKTKRLCPDGIDIVFDFSGSYRVANRVMGLLNEDSVVVTVGDSKLWSLPSGGRSASIGYVNEGDISRVPEIVSLITSGRLHPPKLVPLEKFSTSDADSDADSFRDGESPDVVFPA